MSSVTFRSVIVLISEITMVVVVVPGSFNVKAGVAA